MNRATLGSHLPGLGIALIGAGAAIGLAARLSAVSSLVIAMVLGITLINIGLLRPWMAAGLSFAGKSILRIGVVLLGFRLSLDELLTVGPTGLMVVLVSSTLTFLGALLLGRRLGVSERLSTLVGAGYAICGLSAVAAVESIVGADESETAYAVGLVTLAGTISVFLLPIVGTAMGMDDSLYGRWTGAAVHDVGQTIAAASAFGEGALATAVVVKLTRVSLLAPLVALLGWRHKKPNSARRGQALVPIFIIGFLVAVALRSMGFLSVHQVAALRVAETWAFAIALFAIGCRVSFRSLRRLGGRPLVLGVSTWIVVGCASLAGMALVVR